jgi:nitrite reductase (cytochrome c-552)
MLKTLRNKKVLVCATVVVVALTACVVGCAPKTNPGNATPEATSPTYVPSADKFGVVDASSWADQYPNQYRTYEQNSENNEDGKADYLETNPEIKVLGLGYGYANYYTEPRGHTYSLDTVEHNGRVSAKTTVGCIACKSAQFNALVDQAGNNFNWKAPFWDTVLTLDEGITCANCHENDDPSQLKVTRQQWITAMGNDAGTRSLSGEVCGQCHCDYSMSPTTGEPTSPYTGISTMTPDQALKYYDDNNFVDWTYASTGAKMIAVRHSEYEYNYGGAGNHMTQLGYDCADCHMPTETDANGEAYTSHYWQSPLDNTEMIKNDCSNCHKDLVSEVRATQATIEARTTEVGQRCADFIHNFENAINEGKLTNDQLSRLQTIQRDAAFYWNSAAAENSEGAHNSALYTDVLNRADALLNEGDVILGKASTQANFQAWAAAQGDIFHSTITEKNLPPTTTASN